MFILSLNFVIGLFSWKGICADIFLTSVYMLAYFLSFVFMLSRGQGFDPIYRFNHTKFMCLSQVRTWNSNVICRGFCVLSEFSLDER